MTEDELQEIAQELHDLAEKRGVNMVAIIIDDQDDLEDTSAMVFKRTNSIVDMDWNVWAITVLRKLIREKKEAESPKYLS